MNQTTTYEAGLLVELATRRLLEHARALGAPYSAKVVHSAAQGAGTFWLVLNPGGSPETWKRLGSTEYEASAALPGVLASGSESDQRVLPDAGAEPSGFRTSEQVSRG